MITGLTVYNNCVQMFCNTNAVAGSLDLCECVQSADQVVGDRCQIIVNSVCSTVVNVCMLSRLAVLMCVCGFDNMLQSRLTAYSITLDQMFYTDVTIIAD